MMEELLKRFGDGEDLSSFFDLAAGCSAGGNAALLMNVYDGDTHKIVKDGATFMERLRKGFTVKWMKFLRGKSLDDQLVPIAKDYFQDAPLYNPTSIKAFALSTLRVEQSDEDKQIDNADSPFASCEFQPFLLRTYDLSHETDEDNAEIESVENNPAQLLLPGTCDVKLWEAVVATSAVPVLEDRIEIPIEGRSHRFGDGWAISISPVAIAINEARTIWPNRPIGTFLSFGLDTDDDDMNNRAVEAAKKIDPDMHYLRLLAPTENFFSGERRKKEIEKYIQRVRFYIRDQKAQEIDEMIAKLRSSSTPRQRLGATQTRCSHKKTKRWSTQITNIFQRSSGQVENLMQRLSTVATEYPTRKQFRA